MRRATRISSLQAREPSAAELGRRIRMARLLGGLTLKEMEQRGGISATHISEIERGKASPTVGALGRIAHALGTRPATLVEPTVLPEVSVTRADERALWRVGPGEASLEPVAEPVRDARLGAQILRLPIGRDPAFEHRHPGEEWLTVLSGVVEIRVGDDVFVVREGDSLHFRAHHAHSYTNLASSPAVVLMATRPRLGL